MGVHKMLPTVNEYACAKTHMPSSHINLLEQKEVLKLEKGLSPTGLVWHSNMDVISLFWDWLLCRHVKTLQVSKRFPSIFTEK